MYAGQRCSCRTEGTFTNSRRVNASEHGPCSVSYWLRSNFSTRSLDAALVWTGACRYASETLAWLNPGTVFGAACTIALRRSSRSSGALMAFATSAIASARADVLICVTARPPPPIRSQRAQIALHAPDSMSPGQPRLCNHTAPGYASPPRRVSAQERDRHGLVAPGTPRPQQ